MDVLQFNEQFYKIRIEELEKQLNERNFKIDSLYKELKSRSDELAQQIEKHLAVCEARDENKFRVVQLEKDVSLLKKENYDLKSQLREQKNAKNNKERCLEAEVASYVDQIKKYEEKLEVCEFKILNLKTERSPSTSLPVTSCDNRYNNTDSGDCFKVLQLENDIKLLSLENEDLKLKLEEEKKSKNCRIQTLENHIKSITDKLLKCEESIKEYEAKMIYLEKEKKIMECRTEEYVGEIKKFKVQLESHQNCEKKLEGEKIKNEKLQKELENFKSVCEKHIHPETAEVTKIMTDVEPDTRGILELQECLSIATSYVEQQRILLMKFEQEIEEKVRHTSETISVTEKNPNVLNLGNLKNTEDEQLSKPGTSEKLQEKGEKNLPLESQKKGEYKTPTTHLKVLQVKEKQDNSICTPITPQNKKQQKTARTKVKDSESQKTIEPDAVSVVSQTELPEKVDKNHSVRTPLKPQNRRQQKTAKTEVKDSESLKPDQPNDEAISQKKIFKENKKTKDENMNCPIGPKNTVSEKIKTAVEDIRPDVNQRGRQLRPRRKV